MTFTEYLQQKKYSAKTVDTYTKDSSHFINWLQQEDITADGFTYTELLENLNAA
jgi:site-specific recombinase XerD